MTQWKMPAEMQFSGRFLTVGKSLLLIAILVAVGIFSLLLGIRLAVRGDEVTVPALTGRTVAEAKKELTRLELLLDVTGERYDGSAPAGRIVSQSPAPGGKMKASRSVQVLVSLGARRNPIPNLVGSTLRSGRLMIAQSGYELGNVSALALGDVGREEVVQQNPTPESREVVNTRIDVLINRPRERCSIMPDLLGQNVAVVTAVLERNQLRVQPPVYRSYRNADKGVVVKQYPEPGYMVKPGDSITLEVAR